MRSGDPAHHAPADLLRPHGESTPDRFADGRHLRPHDGKGYRLRFTASIRSHRTVGERGERWRGTFHLKILETHKGRYVDTCRTGRLRFTLRPV